MSNKITHTLMMEHEVILLLSQLLENINGLWETDKNAFTNNLQFMIEFCKTYADKIHHLKEENILFPVMIEQNPMLAQGVVGEMMEQHNMFREYIADIKHYLEKKEYQKSYNIFHEYLKLLEDHIQIENCELFPMADELISSGQNEQMYFQAMDLDNEFQVQKDFLSKKLNLLLNR